MVGSVAKRPAMEATVVVYMAMVEGSVAEKPTSRTQAREGIALRSTMSTMRMDRVPRPEGEPILQHLHQSRKRSLRNPKSQRLISCRLMMMSLQKRHRKNSPLTVKEIMVSEDSAPSKVPRPKKTILTISNPPPLQPLHPPNLPCPPPHSPIFQALPHLSLWPLR